MKIKHWLRGYAVSLAAVAAAVVIRWAVDPWLGNYVPLATLYGAVAIAVWIAGSRAALIAAVLGYGAIVWFFILPEGNIHFFSESNMVGLALYFVSCTLIIGAGDVMRRERRRAQIASEQVRIITDTMAVGVTRCSRDMRYVWVNQPYADWIRVPIHRLVGRRIADVVGADVFAQLMPYYARVLNGETVHYEKEVQFGDVPRCWISATYTPTRDDDGEVDGWVAVVLDITERKQAEAERREADRKKDEFLAMLSHELRNPLAPIGYAAEILNQAEPSPTQLARARGVIARQVRQMTRLLDDLMDVSRIKRGAISLRKEPVELASVVDEALEASRPFIEKMGHTLRVDIPSAPLVLDADATRLSQVLLNLLNNAAKYTERGGIIEVCARREDDSAVISVKDTGVGIPPEMLGRIFELFAQAERSIERAHGGLGIGLTLAQRLVALHGGTLEARSDGPGRGSEFVIRLPLAEESRAVATGVTPEKKNGAHPLRILVVDDNEDSAETMAMYLTAQGHEVVTAHNGLEAVDTACTFQPAAVLLDIGLPRLNGYDAATRIRTQLGDSVMLIALTGWGQEADRRRSRDAGFDHHLTKPAEPDELLRLLALAKIPATEP